MLIRLKFGRYSGEIQDIAPEAALAMLNDGRAEYPDPRPQEEILGGAFDLDASAGAERVSPPRRGKRTKR